MFTEIYKWYRQDKTLWESKISILGIMFFYKYSIWRNGKTKTHYRFFKYKKPIYLKKAITTHIYVGKNEFETKYKGNKYLVPLNYKLDLNLP